MQENRTDLFAYTKQKNEVCFTGNANKDEDEAIDPCNSMYADGIVKIVFVGTNINPSS